MTENRRDGPAPQPSRAFLGRQAELAELTRALADAREGFGRLVLISGEPGIGKSRLADELGAHAARSGALVAWGRCWEAGGAPAYWPWVDVLSALAQALDDGALERALGAGASAVCALVPELRPRVGAAKAVDDDATQARFRLQRAVLGLLRAAASGHGALIVLEDLHAADESSLALLTAVARELRGTHALVLATYRDVEARLTPEVGEALARLSREGTTLSLARLGRDDAERFVRERVGAIEPRVLGQVWSRTQGNPLFLTEITRLLQSDPGAASLAGALPAGVRELIRARLSLVSEPTRALLELIAIAGDEVAESLIADAGGLAPAEVGRAIAEAVRAGLLVAQPRKRVRFSHALVREVLERELPEARAQALHAAVAGALSDAVHAGAAPPHAELAHHLLSGPRAELPRAVEHALCAAEQAIALFAIEDAVSLLERTLDAIERGGRAPALRAAALIALAQAHVRGGQGARCRELCLEAVQIGRSAGDPQVVAQAALAYGLEITAALIDPTLVALLQEALAGLPPGDSALRVQVTARLGAAMQPHADLMYPIGLAREAIASARRLGEPSTLLSALYTGMAAMMDIVDPRERLKLNLEVEQLAADAGDTERLLRTQARLVFDHMELGELDAADARIALFERLAEEAGARRYLWRAPLFRSMRALMHGRFAESEALLERARTLGEGAGDPQLPRCTVFHQEGLLRAWERHADMIAFDPEARRMRAALYSGPHWQNGGSAFTCSRVEDLERTRFYVDLVPQDDWPLVHNPPAFQHLGEPLAMVGRPSLCELLYRKLAPARELCVSWGWTSFVWEGPASRVLGLLAARLGRLDEADACFEHAEAKLERVSARPLLARTRYEHGRALLESGAAEHGPRARELVERAAETAADLGMAGLSRLTEQRLAPRTSGRARASNPPSASTPSASTAAGAALPFTCVREGEYWSFDHQGATFRLKDSLGLQYLARLFAEPGRAIHALELSGAGDDDVRAAHAQGDAGELLDERALAGYRARAAELREELREAEAFADAGRSERARQELLFLEREVSRAVGLGGRRRRAGGAGERARSAVQRRIRNALDRIRESCPELGDLLERSVKTGSQCVFRLEG